MFKKRKALDRANTENMELRRRLAVAQFEEGQAKKRLEEYQSYYKSHVETHTKSLNEERERRIQAEKDSLEAKENLKRQEYENGKLRDQMEPLSCEGCIHAANYRKCASCARYPKIKDKYETEETK